MRESHAQPRHHCHRVIAAIRTGADRPVAHRHDFAKGPNPQKVLTGKGLGDPRWMRATTRGLKSQLSEMKERALSVCLAFRTRSSLVYLTGSMYLLAGAGQLRNVFLANAHVLGGNVIVSTSPWGKYRVSSSASHIGGGPGLAMLARTGPWWPQKLEP